ncbi:MarR family winged helix-turn-helix transcriptional regulator [Nocardioides sp.]|uniref:MarR family winged helix-turn-helix transcriptional regulator n=1 Tax=Nocardioides sp. TaxID=35761 RepID=UPI00356433F3
MSSDTPPDHVDGILAQWRSERPDLDPSPIGVVGRLHRLAETLNHELCVIFASAGLSDGDFDMMAALRRSGKPWSLTPTELAASTMVTSGAITKRVDRLEGAGLVTRTVAEDDARSRRITLTPRGKQLIDDLLPHHLANERRLLAPLTDPEQAELARLLKKWGQGLDGHR